MLGALRKMFLPKPPEAVRTTYVALVAAARNPFFYTDLKVPDTLDGRFDLIVLHLFLLEERLLFIEGWLTPPSRASVLTPVASDSLTLRTPNSTSETAAFAQFLSEAFFDDMDCSLRELGVADTGVSHRIKKMGKAYHGRLQAYAAALGDEQAMCAALARNLYGTVAEGDITALHRMARYVEHMVAALRETDAATITRGAYVWPDAARLGI